MLSNYYNTFVTSTLSVAFPEYAFVKMIYDVVRAGVSTIENVFDLTTSEQLDKAEIAISFYDNINEKLKRIKDTCPLNIVDFEFWLRAKASAAKTVVDEGENVISKSNVTINEELEYKFDFSK